MTGAAEEGELDSPLSWMGELALVLGLVSAVLLVALVLAAIYFLVSRARSRP